MASASISSVACLQQRVALVLVEDGEARRHAGLERKALQQPLAEGVDGLHLEAARRLDGDGEQLPRPLHLGRGGRAVEQLGELALQARLVGRHPLGQPGEHALRHLRGGGLGVGERQDALGRRAAEQQAQHAHGQHVRLAGAGVGADPGGGGRVGGGRLVALRLLETRLALRLGLGREEEAHLSASSIVSADHSATRARWA